jgi:hypothetical protein
MNQLDVPPLGVERFTTEAAAQHIRIVPMFETPTSASDPAGTGAFKSPSGGD